MLIETRDDKTRPSFDIAIGRNLNQQQCFAIYPENKDVLLIGDNSTRQQKLSAMATESFQRLQ